MDKKKTGNKKPNDGLNESQSSKMEHVRETVDQKGVIVRDNVIGQTIFDKMMIDGLIERPQHEAAHLFIDALSRSGANIPSLPFERIESGRRAHTKASDDAERRMIYSDAYRFMSSRVSEDQCRVVMKLCNSPHSFKMLEDKLDDLSTLISAPLWSLAKFYNVDKRRDPRRIIKSQLYFNPT